MEKSSSIMAVPWLVAQPKLPVDAPASSKTE